ncbi:hypothetical protein EC991_002551 [Linnemannia zychae]|nr:hypothetical protein EC991_002551 [Linnemannia zychae]
MRSRSFVSTTTAVAAAAGLCFLSSLSTTAADLTCQQLGAADTFHIGSTLKFTWSDTQTVEIDTFNLNLYCAQDERFLQTITTLNSTSPDTYAWVVNSSIAAFAPTCEYNQYHGSFDWTSTDSETGAVTQNSARCKVMLMIANSPGAPGSAANDPEISDDEPSPSDIVVSDKTKTIVIGVGCAVGLLVLAGIVGFYVIRHSNRRAAEEQMNKKLREPIQSGPLFAPMDRTNGGGNGGAAGRRYNELSSVTTGSETMGHSPATTARTTEMAQFNGASPIGTPVMNHNSSSSNSALGSRSPTPIAAAYAKANAAANAGTNSPSLLSPRSSIATPLAAHYNQDRPTSLLTSSFIPADEAAASGRTSPSRQQQQQQEHYQNEIQMQQMNQQQIQQQLQQQQQQQQQAYSNGYY